MSPDGRQIAVAAQAGDEGDQVWALENVLPSAARSRSGSPPMILLLIAALAVPLGLDWYVRVPPSNPITAEKVELGRRLFNDRRPNPRLDPEIKALKRQQAEKHALVAFLKTLSGTVRDGAPVLAPMQGENFPLTVTEAR